MRSHASSRQHKQRAYTHRKIGSPLPATTRLRRTPPLRARLDSSAHVWVPLGKQTHGASQSPPATHNLTTKIRDPRKEVPQHSRTAPRQRHPRHPRCLQRTRRRVEARLDLTTHQHHLSPHFWRHQSRPRSARLFVSVP